MQTKNDKGRRSLFPEWATGRKGGNQFHWYKEYNFKLLMAHATWKS
jgi:hypothetical protein